MLVPALLLLVLCLVGVSALPRQWRGEVPIRSSEHRDPWVAGFFRATPVGAVGGAVWAVFLALGDFVAPTDGEAPAWWIAATGGVLALAVGIAGLVVMFNVPKAVVPPHRRASAERSSRAVAPDAPRRSATFAR